MDIIYKLLLIILAFYASWLSMEIWLMVNDGLIGWFIGIVCVIIQVCARIFYMMQGYDFINCVIFILVLLAYIFFRAVIQLDRWLKSRKK